MKPILIYLAGPFRAEHAWAVELNVRRAEHAMIDILRLGIELDVSLMPVCVHTMFRHFHGAIPLAPISAGDIELMSRCDVVFMLDQWANSRGASDEYLRARSMKKHIVGDIGELRQYVDDVREG